MKNFAKFLLAVGFFSLAGCDNALQKTVREKLIDPDSAKFGEQTIYLNHACIVVNSKNSYGGYTGNKTAWLERFGTTGDNWYYRETNETPCYDGPLKEKVAIDEAEEKYAGEVLEVLKSKGFKVQGVPTIAHDDKTADKCLAQASATMTSHRIAAGEKGDRADFWKEKRDSELEELKAMECGPQNT